MVGSDTDWSVACGFYRGFGWWTTIICALAAWINPILFLFIFWRIHPLLRILPIKQTIVSQLDLIRRPQAHTRLPSIPSPSLLLSLSTRNHLVVNWYVLLCLYPFPVELGVQGGEALDGVVSPFSLLVDSLKLLHVGFSWCDDGAG